MKNVCESCGGQILGDGITEVFHCENANVPPGAAPDGPVIICGMTLKAVEEDRRWFVNNYLRRINKKEVK